MTTEMIAHEEFIAREDLILNSDLITRINAVRAALRANHALAAADAPAVHDLLGDCAQALADILYQNQRNQMREHIINMALNLMSIAPAPLAPVTDEVELMHPIPAAHATATFAAA